MLCSHNMLRCFCLYVQLHQCDPIFSDFACRTGAATRELHSTALETCTMYWKVSLVSSCSRLCEILFHFALLRSRQLQMLVVAKLLFQGVACFIVATVGWCPLNFALRVTRQAWLQWSGHTMIHMCCVDFSVHATAKNASASYGTLVTYMQYFDGIPGSSFCSSLVGNSQGEQETTFLCAQFC